MQELLRDEIPLRASRQGELLDLPGDALLLVERQLHRRDDVGELDLRPLDRRDHDLAVGVEEAVRGDTGSAVLVYVPHTTAGVTVNEHADPMVARDFENALERIVPADWSWQHVEEGEENAPTHIRAALMGPSVVVPIRDDGSLALGTWQGIFLCELDGPRERSVVVSVLA